MNEKTSYFDIALFRERVRSWLWTQDKQTCELFAARFALRAVPAFSQFIPIEHALQYSTSRVILPAFWALRTNLSAILWTSRTSVAITSSAEAVFHSVNSMVASDYNDCTAASRAVSVCARALAVIYDKDAIAAAITVEVIANDAYSATIFPSNSIALRYKDAYSLDKLWAIDRSKNTSIHELLVQPFWPAGIIPSALWLEWQKLKTALLDLDENWEVWTDWYEGRLAGKPLNKELELAIVNLDLEKYWNKGAAVTNAKIKELIEEHTPKPDISPESLQQLEFGTQFEPSGDQFVIRAMGEQSDFDVAQRPDIQRTHEKLKRKAADFTDMAIRLSNQYGWTNIGRVAQRFEASLRGSTLDVAKDIRDVWEEIVELGSFLEQDDNVRKQKNSGIDPLDPNYRRTLTDLLQTGAPWLREFPTAQELDDNIRKHKASDIEFDTAKEIITSSGSVNILSEQDVETLLAFADAAKRGSVQSEKAKTSTALTGKNIAIAAAALYFAQVAAGAGQNSILVQKGVELYLQSEKAIVQMFHNGPADIRAAIQALLKELSEKENPPTLPIKPKKVLSKKDEDE